MNLWNNASIDKPPKNGQEVVICVEGIYHEAIYDEENDCYIKKQQPSEQFNTSKFLIYWS